MREILFSWLCKARLKSDLKYAYTAAREIAAALLVNCMLARYRIGVLLFHLASAKSVFRYLTG
jgi:hypothetical protein